MNFFIVLVAVTVCVLLALFAAWSLWHYVNALKIRSKRTRRIALTMLTLILLGTVSFYAWGYSVTRALNAEIAKIKARGEPTGYEAMIIPVPPEGMEDAGRYYAAAIALMPNLEIGHKIIKESVNAMPATLSPAERDQLGKAIEAHRESLDAVRRANQIEHCLTHSSSHRGVTLLLPELGQFRRLCNLLIASTLHKTMSGNNSGAVEDALCTLRLSRYLDNETLMAFLVKIACEAAGAKLASSLIESANISESDMKSLENGLRHLDSPSPLKQVFIGERVFGLALTGVLPGDPQQEAQYGNSNFTSFGWPVNHYYALGYMRYMSRVIDAANQPFPIVLDELARAASKGSNELIDAGFERVPLLFARHSAKVRAARLAILCELLRRKHGKLPEKLEELMPEFIEAVPMDPFDGKAMKYKLDGDAVVIYSVSENRQDDGGVVDPPDAKKNPVPPDWGLRVKLGGHKAATGGRGP